MQALIDNVSIPWALRFLGFFSLAVGLAGVSLVRQRPAAKKKAQYKLLDLSVLRVPFFPIFLLFSFVQFFGFITPILLIPSELVRPTRLCQRLITLLQTIALRLVCL